MIKRCDLTDHHQRGIRQRELVFGYVGEFLDLADDVVAKVTNQATVHGWQFLDSWRAVRLEDDIDRSQDALVARHVDAQITIDLDGVAGCGQRCSGSAAHKGKSTPAFTVLDRLEDETWLIADQAGERCDWRGQVSDQFSPYGQDGVRLCPGAELLSCGAVRH